MSLRWLTAAGVQAIQDELISRYGGSRGMRDFGLLESALAREPNLHIYEDEKSIPVLASAVSWRFIKNHAFIDGNKRAGLAVFVTFLELNGWDLHCSEAEETVMVQRAAASEITEAQWREWIVNVTRRK